MKQKKHSIVCIPMLVVAALIISSCMSGPQQKQVAGQFKAHLSAATITAANLEGPLANMSISNLVDRIEQGRAYVNVHTKQNPDGEISGAIR
jgi:hypothetical protein